MENNKLKIAICFYGQVRNYDYLNEDYPSWLDSENFDINFFISSWDDFDKSKLLDIYKDKKFYLYSKYKDTFDKLTREVTLEGLSQDLSPIFVAFHQQNVLKSKIKYETQNKIKYDLTILVRPDYYLNKKQTFEHLLELYNSNLHKLNKPVVSLKSEVLVNRGSIEIPGDSYFIHNDKGAFCHSNLYNYIFTDKIYKNYPIRYINGSHNMYYPLFIKDNYLIIRNQIRSSIKKEFYG